ncbi:uncharacterized protein STEHIDRAFT_118037 [Stereum hirsutum FP-91666 SS1]|uniref:uncharacterized protein n=1 Tax=Stereum hirsutum (strain FP-91666) TaxID=721885 RepID=UPI000440B6AA|nr:uncharacterized protein STEHIDRAFT_118037 [Stereum hirsutum FP-91666 SS1]EIM90780.1 hypothetical protein STEHIDRAFT_118037 [Stereum hirsutum FP-91666 SS1]
MDHRPTLTPTNPSHRAHLHSQIHLQPLRLPRAQVLPLNAGHVCTAYLGFLPSYSTTDAAVRDKRVCEVMLGALEESGVMLMRRYGLGAGIMIIGMPCLC